MTAPSERLTSPYADLALPSRPMSATRQAVLLRLSLITADAVVLGCAFALAYWIRFDLQLSLSPEVVPSPAFYFRVGLALLPLWIGMFALNGLYEWDNLFGGTTEYARAFHACTAGMMLVVAAAFVEPAFVIARGWLVAAWVLSTVLVCAARFAIRRVVYAARRRGQFGVPAIVIGSNGEALSLAEQLMEDPASGYNVIGIVSSRAEARKGTSAGACRIPVLGSVVELPELVARYGVTELLVASSSLARGELLEIFEHAQPMDNVTIRLSTGMYEVLTTGVHVKTAACIPLVSIHKLRLGTLELVSKTALEYTVTLLALLLLAPAMAVIAVLVKLGSPGPVLHRRRVLGVGGKEFDAFKFRTMYVNGDEVLERSPELRDRLESEGKLKDDPRITPLGKTLRRYSLDELPQLFNVLMGQMSLVGPRMITAAEGAKYGRHRLNLLTVKPGITGLWQVSGRSELAYQDRVRLDMYYIRNYSIYRDLQILFLQTPAAVLRGKGAY